jgi:polyhydroxybutyrate depolymerase
MKPTLAVLLALAACGSEPSGPRTKTFGGARPADLKTPDTLEDGKQYPLVVVLHGFGANGFAQYAFFNIGSLVTAGSVLAIAPDGTANSAGRLFWNADPACCDFEGQNPDDVTYIGSLIEDIAAEWPVDPNQVYVIGHSNGGYMAYRMACERADLIAGIVSLAGNASTTASACTPSRAVSVLHLHGTLDEAVPYVEGGTGAVADVTQWATHDGCGSTRTATVTLDLDTLVAGSETHGETTGGCPTKVAVDLWTLEGSSHIPIFAPAIATTLLDWLTAHKR